MLYFITYFTIGLLLFYFIVDRHGKYEIIISEHVPPLLQDFFTRFKWVMVVIMALLWPFTFFNRLKRLITSKNK